DATSYGTLLGAMGVGSLAGALLQPVFAARLRSQIVPCSIAAFGVSTLALAVSHTIVCAVVPLVIAGCAWTLVLATMNGTMQRRATLPERARVMSLYVLAFFGSWSMGSLVWGLVATWVGVRLSLT